MPSKVILKDRHRNALVNLYLFALFVLGLLLSMMMGEARSGFELSEPIPLRDQGLCVSLPVGPGWQIVDQWRYERDSSFTLVGRYAIDRYPIAEIRWQYLLAAQPGDARQILEQQLARYSDAYRPVLHAGEETDFVWAFIQPEPGQEAAVGVSVLSPGRVLILQISARNQPLLAEDLFLALTGSVRYRSPRALETGRRLIETTAGWAPPAETPADEAFLISDESGLKVGYYQARFESAAGTPSQIHLESSVYLRQGRQIQQIRQSLTVEPFLDNLQWTCLSQNTRPRQALEYRLQSGEDQTLRLIDPAGQSHTLRPTAVTVPEPLLPMAAARLLAMDDETALVDVLSCRGQFVPTHLRKIPPPGDDIAAAVRIDYLHSEDNSEELYFDADGELIGKLEKLPGRPALRWQRSTREQILLHFGNLFETPGRSVRGPTPFRPLARQAPGGADLLQK